jgi:hypothetical protein
MFDQPVILDQRSGKTLQQDEIEEIGHLNWWLATKIINAAMELIRRISQKSEAYLIANEGHRCNSIQQAPKNGSKYSLTRGIIFWFSQRFRIEHHCATVR